MFGVVGVTALVVGIDWKLRAQRQMILERIRDAFGLWESSRTESEV